jgi:hypothetical protein
MTERERVYKKGSPGSEYDSYHGKPEQIKRRAERNAARRKAVKSGRVRPGDGKEVDHSGSHRKGSLARVRTHIVPRVVNRRRQPKRS